MKYQVINKKLKIAGCHLADLTMKDTDSFLKSWGEDASIGQLTLFYDEETRYIVLNQDNKDYEHYKEIAELFLSADSSKRYELIKDAPKVLVQTMRVLNRALGHRKAYLEIKRAQKIQCMQFADDDVMKELYDKYSFDAYNGIITAFNYGVMQGKRIERARRKAGVQHE